MKTGKSEESKLRNRYEMCCRTEKNQKRNTIHQHRLYGDAFDDVHLHFNDIVAIKTNIDERCNGKQHVFAEMLFNLVSA